MNKHTAREKLILKGLRVTPQRLIAFEAIRDLKNHPTAENIIKAIKVDHPNISIGTIYKIIDKLVEKKLIKKIKTEKDVMRFDPILEHHHHLYCTDTDRIDNYFDSEMDELLKEYFLKKKISGFKIEEIKLQILGKFSNKKNNGESK